MMKRRIHLLLGLLMVLSVQLIAQVYSSLPPKEREAKLITLARKVYQHERFKDYYKEGGDIRIITRYWTEGDYMHPFISDSLLFKNGDFVYDVQFNYRPQARRERFEREYDAEVTILDSGQGDAYLISIPETMMGWYLTNNEPSPGTAEEDQSYMCTLYLEKRRAEASQEE